MIKKIFLMIIIFQVVCANTIIQSVFAVEGESDLENKLIPYDGTNGGFIQFQKCFNCVYGPKNISKNFVLFGKNYSKIYIHANGFVSFDKCKSGLVNCPSYVSLFTTNIGENLLTKIYHEEINNIHHYKMSLINSLLPRTQSEHCEWAYVITWFEYEKNFKYCNHLNSYQLILAATNMSSSFIIFNFYKINLPIINYLGFGDSEHGFKFLDTAIILQNGSNVNRRGFWRFKVDLYASFKFTSVNYQIYTLFLLIFFLILILILIFGLIIKKKTIFFCSNTLLK